MALPLEVHRRQFVIGPRPLHVTPKWISINLEGAVLSCCPTLPIVSATDRDGNRWHLLGIGIQTRRDRPEPVRDIEESTTSTVPERYSDWAGRWILVGNGEVHMDASGLLGCYYATDVEGALWISSSAAILQSFITRSPNAVTRLVHGLGMDWFPPPASGFVRIRRLLPSQILSLNGEIRHRPLFRAPAGVKSDEQLFDEACDRLETAVRNSARVGTLHIPLSGGLDSRTVLAAAVASGVNAHSFTFLKPFPLMTRGDRILPAQLAKVTGYQHTSIRGGPLSRSRLAVIDEHTARHSMDIDRMYLGRGYWSQVPDQAVVLRGGAFGITRAYYHRKIPSALPPATPSDGLAMLHRAFSNDVFYPDSQAHIQGIIDWVKWILDTPEPDLDWRDRLFWEQRVAGWGSAIEQALDLTGKERIYIANCQSFLCSLLVLPKNPRGTGQIQFDILSRLAPELGRFPINPSDKLLPRIARKLRNETRRLRYARNRGAYWSQVLRRNRR